MSLKEKMIRSYIWSVVTYGSEAWTINKEVRDKIIAFECWVYRRVLKISWKDRVSKKEVLERIGIKMRLLSSIAKRKAAFFGHICRWSSGKDILTILEGRVDDVKDWFNIKDYGSLKGLSEDREAWKLLIDNLRLP